MNRSKRFSPPNSPKTFEFWLFPLVLGRASRWCVAPLFCFEMTVTPRGKPSCDATRCDLPTHYRRL